jgi:hypothetical protein
MTLSELLEELKGIDPETADDIGDIVNVISILSDGSFSSDAYYPDFIIQGCIQRAIEQREWDLRQDQWVVNLDSTDEVYYYSAIVAGISETGRSPEYEGRGKSQADALLAAYIAAVKGEKQ